METMEKRHVDVEGRLCEAGYFQQGGQVLVTSGPGALECECCKML